MHIPTKNLAFYRYWAWLWIGLGLCSVGGGLYIVSVIRSYAGRESMDLLGAVAVTLIVVGLLRIANCIQTLRAINRRPIDFDR